MPTYGYLCPKCGHEYEKLQKMSDTASVECPECGTLGERMIHGGAGIVFKGSGFYETDYKRAGEKKESAEPKTKKSDTKKEDSSKTTKKSGKGDSS